jgi:hypothetical protein
LGSLNQTTFLLGELNLHSCVDLQAVHTQNGIFWALEQLLGVPDFWLTDILFSATVS